jgi:sialate O-acetylesterase
MKQLSLWICLLLGLGTPALSQVRLPKLISDGMVLQRDAKVNLWGWARPGEKVNIKFNGKTYHTTTTPDGKWKAVLSPTKAGGPYTMDIIASNHLVVNDILMGDVWLASGQSNMQLDMNWVKEKYPDEISNANNPQIRQFIVPTMSAPAGPKDDLPAIQWLSVIPQNLPAFSAAAYFFSKALYAKYHVPIGVINASVGGTPIEAWTSEEGLKAYPDVMQTIAQLKDTSFINRMNQINREIGMRAMQRTSKKLDMGLTGEKPWYDTTYRPDSWHNIMVPGYWNDQGIKGLNGVVWYRKEINLPASMANVPATISLGRIVDADELYVNGILSGTNNNQYPLRYYKLPEGRLKPGKNILVIRVSNTAGKGGIVPDKANYLSAGGQTISLKGEWQYKVGQAFVPNPDAGKGFALQNQPTVLYNAMIAPLTQYTLKGMLWYQGESNSQQAERYAQLLPGLIADWRSKWQQGNLPFLFVQLPNFNEAEYLPGDSKWAEFREAQMKALSTPNTDMAVTIDVGEWNDIHPVNKKPVGDRLVLLAQKLAYGDTKLVASGPLYQSAKIDGNKMIISFTNTGSGLVTKGGTLQYFAIAGANKQFVWAKASIEGNKIMVWSDDIQQPMYVRYAWAENPEGANLYNLEDLPAAPFRTDTNP